MSNQDAGPDQRRPQLLLHPGALIDGQYRLERPGADTPSGTTWLASDLLATASQGPEVLLKLYPPCASPDALARAREWVTRFALLHRAHIVPIRKFGRVESSGYLVTDPVAGERLDHWIERYANGVTLRQAESLLSGIASVVEACGDRGIVIQSLSPANIAYDEENGGVKIFNFDLPPFIVDEPGPYPEYGSPESLCGAAPSIRDDVYSFACIVYKLLSGKLPFNGSAQGPRRDREPPLPLPNLSGQQNRILLRSLAPTRAQRYPSVRPLQAVLELTAPGANLSELKPARSATLKATAPRGPTGALPPVEPSATEPLRAHRSDAAPSTSQAVNTVLSREVEPVLPRELEPLVAREVEPVLSREVEPVIAQAVEPVIAPEVEPVLSRELEPVIAREVEPALSQEAEPVIAQEMEPVLKVEPVIAHEVEPVVVQEPEPVIGHEMEPVIVRKAEPVLSQESGPVRSRHARPAAATASALKKFLPPLRSTHTNVRHGLPRYFRPVAFPVGMTLAGFALGLALIRFGEGLVPHLNRALQVDSGHAEPSRRHNDRSAARAEPARRDRAPSTNTVLAERAAPLPDEVASQSEPQTPSPDDPTRTPSLQISQAPSPPADAAVRMPSVQVSQAPSPAADDAVPTPSLQISQAPSPPADAAVRMPSVQVSQAPSPAADDAGRTPSVQISQAPRPPPEESTLDAEVRSASPPVTDSPWHSGGAPLTDGRWAQVPEPPPVPGLGSAESRTPQHAHNKNALPGKRMFAHGPAPVQDHASTSTHRAFKFPNLAAAPAPRPPASNPISAAAKAPEPAGRELDTLIEQRLRAAAMRGFGYASNVPVQWASVDLAAAARATSALSNQAAAVGGTPVLLSTSVVPARATGVDLAAAARSTPLVPARATDIDLRGAARGTTGMLARATDVDLAAAARATSSLTAQETAIDLAAAARATSALTAQATAHSRLNNQKVAPALVMGDPLSPSAAEQPERQSAIQVAPQITPQAPEATPHSVPAAYWYYCRHPSGYYPYVKQCYGRWERVMPRPSVRG